MRWPFVRRRPRSDTGGRQAREQAEVALAETRAETPHYEALGRDLREIRVSNHLARAFVRAAGGGRQ